jgi:hypothetical protein
LESDWKIRILKLYDSILLERTILEFQGCVVNYFNAVCLISNMHKGKNEETVSCKKIFDWIFFQIPSNVLIEQLITVSKVRLKIKLVDTL